MAEDSKSDRETLTADAQPQYEHYSIYGNSFLLVLYKCLVIGQLGLARCGCCSNNQLTVLRLPLSLPHSPEITEQVFYKSLLFRIYQRQAPLDTQYALMEGGQHYQRALFSWLSFDLPLTFGITRLPVKSTSATSETHRCKYPFCHAHFL